MFTRNRFIHICLILAMTVFVLKADAVVATAKVTVNVVPLSSFFISRRIVLNIPVDKDNQAQHKQNQVEINTLSNKVPLKIHFHAEQNVLHDISISSRSILTSSFSSDTIAINDMRLRNTSLSISGDDEQALQIDGLLTKPADRSLDTYTGTAEITINYN